MTANNLLVGYVRKGTKGSDDLIFKLSDGRIGLIDKSIKNIKLNENEVWIVKVIVSKQNYAIVVPIKILEYKHLSPVRIVNVDIVKEEESRFIIKVADKEFSIERKQ